MWTYIQSLPEIVLIIFFAVVFLGDVIFFAFDKYIWSTVVFLVAVWLLFRLIPPAATFVSGHGLRHFWLFQVPIYLGIGVVVSTLKWLGQIWRVSFRLADLREHFTPKEQQVGGDNRYIQFLEFCSQRMPMEYGLNLQQRITFTTVRNEDDMVKILTPKASKNIDRITSWVLQWPIVILSTLLKDLLFRLGHWLSRLFDLTFGRLARRLVTNAVKGL